MNDRLAGQAYRSYWEKRMASGPAEASFGGHPEDVDPQADLFFNKILSSYPQTTSPIKILEFGSGYGRILKKVRKAWPGAHLVGVEMTEAASKASWRDEHTTILRGEKVPAEVREVDFAYTCTVLQHITDDDVFQKAAESIEQALAPGGFLTCLENVKVTPAAHLRSSGGVQGYMGAFRSIVWIGTVHLLWRDEPHATFFGVKEGS